MSALHAHSSRFARGQYTVLLSASAAATLLTVFSLLSVLTMYHDLGYILYPSILLTIYCPGDKSYMDYDHYRLHELAGTQ